MKTAPEILLTATIVGLVSTVVGGGIWVGKIEVKAENAVRTASKVEAIQVDQAVIKEQVKRIREDNANLARQLDRLLEAIQARNNTASIQ
jgi:outer membrane murein-binding lipoprotein Lpp